MYFLGCPDNVLRLAPWPVMCGLLAAWVLLQAAVLHLQVGSAIRRHQQHQCARTRLALLPMQTMRLW